MIKIKKLIRILSCLFLLVPITALTQQKYHSATIAFYNVENLFDTVVSTAYIDGNLSPEDPLYHRSIPKSDQDKYDTVYFRGPYTYEAIEGKRIIRPLILQEDEFSPKGSKVWNNKKYQRKLDQLAFVINNIGREETQNAPVILGISEIETHGNLEDLANHKTLKPYNYGIVHFNSFDARGVDVGLMYQKARFKVTLAKPYPVEIYSPEGHRRYTRDILRVTGELDGEEITFLVAHWPSRFGGEKRSLPSRMAAAEVMKGIFDEIRAENPNAKIIAMGDFNDDPINHSIKKGLGTVGKREKVKKEDIYNPMEVLYKRKGIGTLAYRDAWNVFDQILVTGTLIDHERKYDSYNMLKTEIFSPNYLRTPDGQYKGFPYRSFRGDTFYPDGFSDHFPVYSILIRAVK